MISDGRAVKNRIAYLTVMFHFVVFFPPVSLMIINMQMNPWSKTGALWVSVNNYCVTLWVINEISSQRRQDSNWGFDEITCKLEKITPKRRNNNYLMCLFPT